MPFEWTLNPYRGCTHGCHYCYARRYHTQFELGADDEFASVIFVKTNFVEVLRRELQKPSWQGDYVAVGTATDCYQPIEGHYKLTRAARGALRVPQPGGRRHQGTDDRARQGRAAGPVARAGCSVYISVPCVDEDVWRQLEPGTAPPLQRLRAVRELVDAGVRAGVLMNPIVPGISSKPALIERTMKAIADHGARFVGCNVMFLEGGTRDHFMRWLDDGVPAAGRRLHAALRAQVRADGVPQGGASGRQAAERKTLRRATNGEAASAVRDDPAFDCSRARCTGMRRSTCDLNS